MADHNDQYDPAGSKFFTPLPQGTGAPGSPGAAAEATSGTPVGSPVVSTPLASSQVPAHMPTVTVLTGDTTGASDDTPIHAGPLLPNASAASTTGAGDGHSVMTAAGVHRPYTAGR